MLSSTRQQSNSLNSWLNFVEMVPPPEALQPGEPKELAILWRCLQKIVYHPRPLTHHPGVGFDTPTAVGCVGVPRLEAPTGQSKVVELTW